MTITGTSACRHCSLPLRADDDPNYASTVFAKATHECARATKVTMEAARGAAMFASHDEFVHARLINPGVTVESWTSLLQELTTTHDLAHRVIDITQGKRSDMPLLVVSTRVDYVPDLKAVLASALKQMESAWGIDSSKRPTTTEEPQTDTVMTQAASSPSAMRKFVAIHQQGQEPPAGNRAERRRKKNNG